MRQIEVEEEEGVCDAVGKEVKANESGKAQNREKKYSLHVCQQTHALHL